MVAMGEVEVQGEQAERPTGAAASRVARHTAEHVNRRIRGAADRRIQHYAQHREQIDARLRELEGEWDMERTLEANAATLALTGVLLGAWVSRKFLILPAVVTAFLLQHAVQGWCPPVPVLRRLGVRTEEEIQREYYALKALRGDFGEKLQGDGADRAEAVIAAVGSR